MIEMVDDCSRVITGARLYSRELLPAYLDLLSKVFEQYGLPLSLYAQVKVGIDATVPVGAGRIGISLMPGKTVTRCEHTDGFFTLLAKPPGQGGKPIVLLRYENSPGRRETVRIAAEISTHAFGMFECNTTKTAVYIVKKGTDCYNAPCSGRWSSTSASNSSEKNYLTDSGGIII